MKTIIKAPRRRNPAPTERPISATTRLRGAYTWGQYLLFLSGGYITLFVMTAMGRPGA